MPVGNIVISKAKGRIRKSMGLYSPYAFNAIGGPLDQVASGLNATEAQVLSKVPGAIQQIGRVVYESTKGNKAIGRVARVLVPKIVGAVADGTEPIPQEYLIKIKSQHPPTLVVAVMQDKVTFRATSEWEPFLPLGAITNTVNSIAQFTSGRALLSRFMTRRIWKGTSPVEVVLNLIFESINDTFTNVVAPCKALLKMALPSDLGNINLLGVNIPLVAPPGPSPFATDTQESFTNETGNTADEKTAQGIRSLQSAVKAGGDQITIKIGNYLQFNSVIIRDVQPVFDSKLSVDGWPMRAEVSVTFETYEILTKETLDKSLPPTGQDLI